MLPSEKLRLLISKIYGIDLEKYAWSEELKNAIFSIELDKSLEFNAKNLGEIYQYGFNIGHCGLTSRYVVRNFENATLNYGISEILKGTKASPNGEHAWSIVNDTLIDTTLMLCIPVEKMSELGYVTKKTIAKEGAKILSEYELYDNDFREFESNSYFQDELFIISR